MTIIIGGSSSRDVARFAVLRIETIRSLYCLISIYQHQTQKSFLPFTFSAYFAQTWNYGSRSKSPA
jgi:hypothetical protein